MSRIKTIQPKVCSGASGCEYGGCPGGQVCYHIESAFEEESYCVTEDICAGTMSRAEAGQWDQDSSQRARTVRARRNERFGGSPRGGASEPTAVPGGLRGTVSRAAAT